MASSLCRRRQAVVAGQLAFRRDKRLRTHFGLRPQLESLERRDLLASYTTLEDSPLTVSDPALAGAVIVTPPDHGKVSFAATGGFVYTPNHNYNGPDRFIYGTSPTNGTTPPTTGTEVSITITPVNDPPEAHGDQFLALQNTTLTIDSPGVLKNDTDIDSNALTATLVAQASHGIVTLKDGGGFTYVPATDYTGPDSFTYNASDGQATSNTATVSLYVANNTVIARDNTYFALQNTVLNIAAPGVLGNDSGINGRPLTASLEPNTGPLHGTLTLNTDGSFSYTPAKDYFGPDSFVYRATDVSPLANPLPPASATAKVTINVRSTAPIVVANDDNFIGIENTTLSASAPGVLKNDYVLSPDSTAANGTSNQLAVPLTAVLVTNASNGAVTLNADGSFSYVPNKNFYGSDSFTYRAVLSPPAGSTIGTTPNSTSHDIATVWIYIRPPVAVARPDSYSTLQNTALAVDAPGVLQNDFVWPGDPTSMFLANPPPDNHPLNLPLVATLAHTTGFGDLQLNADGSFKYVPRQDFLGTDTFTYRATIFATDENGNPTEPVPNIGQYNVTTVAINVKPINPPPLVANNDYFDVYQGITLVADPPGVLLNDRGPDGHQLAAVLDHTTSNGTLQLTSVGGFTYTPNSGFIGADTFTYHFIDTTAADGATTGSGDGSIQPPASNVATVTITVKSTHPPVYAFDDYYKTAPGAELKIEAPGVLGNDCLVLPVLSAWNNTVPTVLGCPVTVAGAYQYPDPRFPNNLTVTATLLTDVSNGTLSFHEDGSFTYAPKEGFTGADTFTYQARATVRGTTDNGEPATPNDPNVACLIGGPCPTDDIATVTIFVKPPELPSGPVAIDDYFIAAENTELAINAPGVLRNDYFRGVLPNPADLPILWGANETTPPPSLAAVLVAGPSNGTLTLNLDGSFKYEPKADFVGTDTFTYQAQVGPTPTNGVFLMSDIATVTIKVVPAIAHNDQYQTQQDTTLNIAKPGVLANDSGGSSAHPLMATQLSGPLHGTLTLSADGSFVYTPKAGYSGPDLFTYRASDGTPPPPTNTPPGTNSAIDDPSNGTPTNAIDVGIVRIYVQPFFSGIQAHDDKFPAVVNTTLDIPAPGVLANDFGPVNVPVIATLVTDVQRGVLKLNTDGSFSYTPDTDFTGEVKFVYSAAPADPNSSIKGSNATVTIYVIAANAIPKVIIGDNQTTTDEAGPQNVTDWATVCSVDDDGQPATFTVTTDNPKLFTAQPTIDPTGQLTYTPAPNVSGDANITVVTHEDSGDTTQTFSIHVDKPHPLFNAANPYDVNNDKFVAPNDVVALINYLNTSGDPSVDAPAGEADDVPYYDVSRDNFIAPNDALMIINAINAGLGGGAGEATASNSEAAASDTVDAGLLTLVAQDTAEATMGRKRSG